MARRSGLGRGLGAIIPTEETARDGAVLREVPVSAIRPNPHQPRQTFDEDALAGLAASVRALGVLQPVLVREVADGDYELVAGERRWRAAQRAGLDRVPAIVRPTDDGTSLQQALVENLHRADLSPLEEAAAYEQLREDFGLTQDEIADRVGKSRSAVANTVRLLQLPTGLQALVASGALSAGHGRALLGCHDSAFQAALADRVAASGLSVREVEQAVRDHESAPASAERPPPGTTKAAALLELETLLADQLATRVRVELGVRKGRIEIEFADLEDLERIFLLIS